MPGIRISNKEYRSREVVSSTEREKNMKIKNIEIRNAIEKKRLRHYEVAYALGISECTLSRWLRKELPIEQQKEIINVINSID